MKAGPTKNADTALGWFQKPRARSLAGAAVLASFLLAGCASTSDGDSEAGKVWMRDGSTANSEFDENTCRATASTAEDFRLCMMTAGWKLETPPGS